MRRRKIFTVLAAAAGAALMAAAVTASPAKADTSGTTTSLWLQSNTVVWGSEYAFEMSVGVNAPVGGWAITAGSPTFGTRTLCSGDLSTRTWCFMPDGALPPGTYNLIATYNGTEDYSPSASGLGQLTVLASEPSALSLRLSSATAAVGDEQSDVISFSATDAVTGRPAEGTVTVAANGRTLSQCEGVWVLQDSGGTGSCTLTASELPPGSYSLTATFDGSQDFGNATATRALTVTGAPTAAISTLTLSAPAAIYSQEQAEQLAVQVTSTAGGTPTGTVTINAGSTTVCTSITLSSGRGTCQLPPSGLFPGSYQLTATYNGDTTFSASTSTPQPLTVTGAGATSTSLTLSAAQITAGNQQAERFTASAGGIDGPPTGQVTIRAGSATICTITLDNGTGSCSPAAGLLSPGSYQVTAAYSGDNDFAGSASAPQALTLTS